MSLEMPLINCKIHLELNWNNNYVMHGPDTYAGGVMIMSIIEKQHFKQQAQNCMFQLSLYQLKKM